MPHATNIRAFNTCDATAPFLRLYTLLVAIELALKDNTPTYIGGHDLQRLALAAIPSLPSGLSAQLTALQVRIAGLICTSRHGNRSNLNPTNFPELRYLRHDVDFPGDTTSAEVALALDAARQLVKELNSAGVTL